jgi:hypothetical protein
MAFPQPQLTSGFSTPAEDTCQDAGLVVRLLRLNPSRALPLPRLQNPEREAARRLVAGHAAKLHEGLLAATEHLRFSHYPFALDNVCYVNKVSLDRSPLPLRLGARHIAAAVNVSL